MYFFQHICLISIGDTVAVSACLRFAMLGTPRFGDDAPASSTGRAMAAMSFTSQAAKIAWDYAYEKVDGQEAVKRLGKATAGTAGGIVINHGVATLAHYAGRSLGPLGQFACTVLGNMAGSWVAEKFMEWVAWLFATDPMEGYRRACKELEVSENAHRLVIKRALAAFHPDKGSSLTSEQFEKKKLAFELIKATRNRMNTWDDEDVTDS